MRIVIQVVSSASVAIAGKQISAIGTGLLLLVGLHKNDTIEQFDPLIKKVINLRIFPDESHKINKSIVDINGELLLVSQFTLYADCKKGNRPSFADAMPPAQANEYYGKFVQKCRELYPKVKEGVFGADMQVTLVNDGPLTIILEG
jgi:D-aminoacyl-tRNA deacylase